MEPNKFGIMRNKDLNLFACMFGTIIDNLSEFTMNIITPEYISGSGVGGNGSVYSTVRCKYATVNLDGYDYALLPLSSGETGYGLSSGMGTTTPATLSPRMQATPSALDEVIYGYMLLKIPSTRTMANITVDVKSGDPPVIAFKRYRNDNVNPKGIIIPPPDPDLKKESPEQEGDPEEKE